MYAALSARDASFEGIFFTAVKTTGIFCRPTCTAKRRKRENIEFFGSPSEAMHAGYRPCLRCRPLDIAGKPPALVEKLRAAVEREPTGRLTDKELLDLGIEPSTARRQFKKYHGMTFHAYHGARRMGLALHDVTNGQSVTDTQMDHGFESSSGFRDAFSKIFGRPPSDATQQSVLFAQRIETPLGTMLALANDAGLYLLDFVDRRGLERELLRLRRMLKGAAVPGSHPVLDETRRQLALYFSGERFDFDLPLATVGSHFQRRAWEFLKQIPVGETRSYSEEAVALKIPQARRAVGNANGQNFRALVIPCHRVIRSDGTLCGYGGGLWRKKWLIEHERRGLRS